MNKNKVREMPEKITSKLIELGVNCGNWDIKDEAEEEFAARMKIEEYNFTLYIYYYSMSINGDKWGYIFEDPSYNSIEEMHQAFLIKLEWIITNMRNGTFEEVQKKHALKVKKNRWKLYLIIIIIITLIYISL